MNLKKLTLLIFVFGVFWGRCASAQVIAAGGDNEDGILPTFVKMAGGPKARLFILAAARLDAASQEQTIASYRKTFSGLGVLDNHITSAIIVERGRSPQQKKCLCELIEQATGICVSGGDQSVLAHRIRGTPLHTAILKAVARGCVYYGNSAGTAVIGRYMIGGDYAGKITLEEGLGIVPGIILEQHYKERHREWRLRAALQAQPTYVGCGVDERTAVIFMPENKREVVGMGTAHELAALGN